MASLLFTVYYASVTKQRVRAGNLFQIVILHICPVSGFHRLMDKSGGNLGLSCSGTACQAPAVRLRPLVHRTGVPATVDRHPAGRGDPLFGRIYGRLRPGRTCREHKKTELCQNADF